MGSAAVSRLILGSAVQALRRPKAIWVFSSMQRVVTPSGRNVPVVPSPFISRIKTPTPPCFAFVFLAELVLPPVWTLLTLGLTARFPPQLFVSRNDFKCPLFFRPCLPCTAPSNQIPGIFFTVSGALARWTTGFRVPSYYYPPPQLSVPLAKGRPAFLHVCGYGVAPDRGVPDFPFLKPSPFSPFPE